MKCTAMLQYSDCVQERGFNVPVLPLCGDTVTFHDGSFIVKRIEFLVNKDGLTYAINVWCQSSLPPKSY